MTKLPKDLARSVAPPGDGGNQQDGPPAHRASSAHEHGNQKDTSPRGQRSRWLGYGRLLAAGAAAGASRLISANISMASLRCS